MDFVFIDGCFGLEDRRCDSLYKVGGWCFSERKVRCLWRSLPLLLPSFWATYHGLGSKWQRRWLDKR